MNLAIGFDDNGQEAGIDWALELLEPHGTATFFLTARYEQVAAWRRIHAAGHEIGNHSVTHATTRGVGAARWRAEMRGCNDFLEDVVGIPRDEITGFRAPYLEVDDDALAVAHELGFQYDCSIEDGKTAPYRLPSGLWELPVGAVVVPPALRATMAARQPWFDGGITAFDYNLWASTDAGGFAMTRDEFVATVAHTLELGRAPLMFGAHTDYYVADWDAQAPNAPSVDDRRAALAELIERAGRVASYRQVLDAAKTGAAR